jgi:hypothetical protein
VRRKEGVSIVAHFGNKWGGSRGVNSKLSHTKGFGTGLQILLGFGCVYVSARSKQSLLFHFKSDSNESYDDALTRAGVAS